MRALSAKLRPPEKSWPPFLKINSISNSETKGRTARELGWHLVAADCWFADGIAKGDFSQPETETPPNASVQDMLALYDQFPAKLEKLKALSGEDLAKPVSFFGVMQLPNVMYLSFLTNHSIHHRGQLSTYLQSHERARAQHLWRQRGRTVRNAGQRIDLRHR